jgi:hypothetical protein
MTRQIIRFTLTWLVVLVDIANGFAAPPLALVVARSPRVLPEPLSFVRLLHKELPNGRNRIGSWTRLWSVSDSGVYSIQTQAEQKEQEQQQQQQQQQDEAPRFVGVVAPLKYIGPYPCLSLNFPKLLGTTRITGTTLTSPNDNHHHHDHGALPLDFLLDTGANINTVNAQFANKYALDRVESRDDELAVGKCAAAAGVGGTIEAGEIYMLGDCELVGLPQPFTFLRNLTAASFPLASPTGSGLLGQPFFQSFPAGVEFDWHGTNGDPPTIIFYAGHELRDEAQANTTMIRVPLDRLPLTHLLFLNVTINGVTLPALLDTGSPVTVLNRHAARDAGIETAIPQNSSPVDLQEQLQRQEAQSHHHHHGVAIGDKVILVGGFDSRPLCLLRSQSSNVPIQVGSSMSLGQGPVYVGDFPGLRYVTGVEGKGPAVVLGLDFLQQTHRMILRATVNEVWFEELPGQLEHRP